MLILSCQDIKKSFNHNPVLTGVNFEITPTDRIALIGDNGSGKTTLAKIIAGEEKPDFGRVVLHSFNLKIGYLTQGREETPAEEEFPRGFLATSKQLGLEKVSLWEKERLKNASGGEKTKLALAMIWNQNPDLLILDEPTNHLDEQGIEWLIDQLNQFPGSLLVISHDRYFLDGVTQKTLELRKGKTTLFPGNYSFYREEKAHQKKTQKRIYEKEMKEENKLKKEITRTKNWAKSGHDKSREKARENKKGGKEFFRARAAKKERQVKSKLKRLEKLTSRGTKKPQEDIFLNIDLTEPQKRGRRILEINEGTKAFGSRILFNNSSFFLLRGERLALRGPNGCGKTSLLKIISGEESLDQGEIWLSPSIKMEYLPQEEKRPIPRKRGSEILSGYSKEKKEWIITLLSRMGFPAYLLERPLENLSYGERRRFTLCYILLNEPDLLLLDEPTTHLDLSLRVALENALETFRGTLIMVCHDRYLVDALCSHQLIFEGNSLRKIPWKKETDSPREKDDLMVVETRITKILGELSSTLPGTEKYEELDREFNELILLKNKIKTGKIPGFK